MRVISGSARGRRLTAREGLDVRPTAERVKEGLFSAIQFDLEGRRVLDLFAGTGQLGIEALSRGAARCVFVDNDPASVAVIRQNVSRCGFDSVAQTVRSDAFAYLTVCREKFDILFLDPPFAENIWERAIEAAERVLTPAAMILCEHPDSAEIPPTAGFEPRRRYRYGKTAVTLLRRAEGNGYE